jgi:hypothetical protein
MAEFRSGKILTTWGATSDLLLQALLGVVGPDLLPSPNGNAVKDKMSGPVLCEHLGHGGNRSASSSTTRSNCAQTASRSGCAKNEPTSVATKGRWTWGLMPEGC